jgi:diacylglycerol kinase
MQLAFAAVSVYLGWALHVSVTEWCLIVLCIFGVLVAEAINTAMEVHVNLTNPETHPSARDTKDVAAGAVLLAALGSGIVGVLIFVPKLLPILSSLLS